MNNNTSDKIIKFFENDRFAFENDIKLVEVSPGYAVAELRVSDRHMNAVNIVQGGAIFTLADLAFAAAANSYGSVTVGINAGITYFKSPKGNLLTAKASKVSSTKNLCCYNVDIFDETNDLVARFIGNGFVKKDKLEI
jgi:acyl-CoA thioesterase